MNLRGVAEYIFGQCRDCPNDVLTAIEHQQQSLLAQKCQNVRRWPVRDQAQLRCKRTLEQSRVLDGREVEKVDGPLKFRKQSVRQCQDDGRLADPASADDRYETLLFQAGSEFANRIVATHQ